MYTLRSRVVEIRSLAKKQKVPPSEPEEPSTKKPRRRVQVEFEKENGDEKSQLTELQSEKPDKAEAQQSSSMDDKKVIKAVDHSSSSIDDEKMIKVVDQPSSSTDDEKMIKVTDHPSSSSSVDHKKKRRKTSMSKVAENRSEAEPPNWRTHLANIRAMRERRDAPVDSEGASALADKDCSPHLRRYQVLVSLMLSSQTKDNKTAEAMKRLKEAGLSVEWMLTTSQARVAELISPVGMYKRKSEFLKKCAVILNEKYANDIPKTVKDLVALPGVGPKMAHLVMDIAWGEVSGIGVDTHVQRITRRLGWVSAKPAKGRGAGDPEETRKALEEWLPRSEWSDLNWLLVGFGQQLCLPVRPKCSECLNKDCCPSSSAKTAKN